MTEKREVGSQDNGKTEPLRNHVVGAITFTDEEVERLKREKQKENIILNRKIRRQRKLD